MYIQQSFVFTHEVQHLILKRLRPPLALIISSMTTLMLLSLKTLCSIILMKVLHWSWSFLHSFSIRQVLMVSKGWCVMVWKVVVGLEVIDPIIFQLLNFFPLIGTFLSKSLINTFLFCTFHSTHFICLLTSSFLMT